MKKRTNIVLAFFALAFGSKAAELVLRLLNVPTHRFGWLAAFGISAVIVLGAVMIATWLTPQTTPTKSH